MNRYSFHLIAITILLYSNCVSSSAQLILQETNNNVVGGFYDPVSNQTFTRLEINNTSTTRQTLRQRPPFFGGGRRCSCLESNCGCCAGLRLIRLNFSRLLCTNLTYDAYDFSIKVDITMNDRSLYTNKVSAKNPPPICIPLPIGRGLDFCLKFFNVFQKGRNLHLCLDFEARIRRNPILILHFDCMRMGQNGVVFLKPEDDGGELPTEIPDTSEIIDGPDTGVSINGPDPDPDNGVPEETNYPDGLQPIDPIVDGPQYPIEPIVDGPQHPIEPIIDGPQNPITPQYPVVQPAQPSIDGDDGDPPQTDFDIYDEVNEIKAN